MHLTFASYNIHKAVGIDGRRDADRIIRVLHEMDADVVALQEIQPHQARGLARLLGWQRHELEGSSFYDFIHPQDSVAAVNACTELALGQSFSRVENRFRHKDGSYRWLRWSAEACAR